MKLIFLVIQIILAIGLIGSVLLQRTSTDGLSGLSGGSGNNIFSSRTSANILTKITAILMFLFVANSLLLGNMITRESSVEKVFDKKTKTHNSAPSTAKESDIQPLKAPLVK